MAKKLSKSKDKSKSVKPKSKTTTIVKSNGRIKKTTVKEGQSYLTPIIVGGVSGVGLGMGCKALDGAFPSAPVRNYADPLKLPVIAPIVGGVAGLIASMMSSNASIKVGLSVFGLTAIATGAWNFFMEGQALRAKRRATMNKARLANKPRLQAGKPRLTPVGNSQNGNFDENQFDKRYTTPQFRERQKRNALGLPPPTPKHTICYA